jgi:sugar/nucleoside kinase (ribokinase family)
MPRDIDVLVLGGAGVDTVVHVPELPLPPADSYQVPAIVSRAGQTGDFVAIGLHALGLRTVHLDLLGDDHEGRLVKELHASRGIELVTVPSASGTKRAVNLVDPLGRRLSLYDSSRGGDADRLPPDRVAYYAGRAKHCHVSITKACGPALRALDGTGVTVSTDLHNWDGVNPYHEQFAFAADIVFFSTSANPDFESTMHRIIKQGKAIAVLATDGPNGSYLLSRGSTQLRHEPAATPPKPAVDSNGAGDSFAAGFLFGHFNGETPETSQSYGSIAGAYACTVPSSTVDAIDRGTLLASTPLR